MKKFFMSLVAAVAVLVALPLLAQFAPSGGSSPHAVVKKLEKENFRNIKLLYSPIMNYGGGEAEFNRLIAGYAEATSRYFGKEYEEAATSFKKNEKDINETGMIIAGRYKDRASKLHQQMIEFSVKLNIKNSLENKKNAQSLEKLVNESSESLAKANDLYARSKPAEAIMMYRRAKEKAIAFFDIAKDTFPDAALSDEYNRDRKDNESQIFVSKEKEN